MNTKNNNNGTVDKTENGNRFLIGEKARRAGAVVSYAKGSLSGFVRWADRTRLAMWTPCRLQVGDTADCKSALRGNGELIRALTKQCPPVLLVLLLAGCVATPQTTIRGTLNGSPFEVRAPKDGDVTGFDLVAETNGAVRLRIEHLTVKMNPDVIGQAGAAQRGLIEATGVAASNITAAAVAAALRGAN